MISFSYSVKMFLQPENVEGQIGKGEWILDHLRLKQILLSYFLPMNSSAPMSPPSFKDCGERLRNTVHA